jgi:hypothetical protein
MDAVVSKILDAVPDIDPDVALEAYMRIVPVFTANIITLADAPTASYLTKKIFNQVADVERVSGISGILDHVVESTEILVYSNYGVKRGETLELKGGGGKEGAIVLANNADSSITPTGRAAVAQAMEDQLIKEEFEAKMLEIQERKAESRNKIRVANANVERIEREATVYGQMDTPENRIISGMSSLFSGAVLVFLYTAAATAKDVALAAGAVAGASVVEAGSALVEGSKGMAVSATGALGGAFTGAAYMLGNALTRGLTFGLIGIDRPAPVPEAPAPPPPPGPTATENILNRSDGIITWAAEVGNFVFQQVSTTRVVFMALSLWVILTIISCVVLKGGLIFTRAKARAWARGKGSDRLFGDNDRFQERFRDRMPRLRQSATKELTNVVQAPMRRRITQAPAVVQRKSATADGVSVNEDVDSPPDTPFADAPSAPASSASTASAPPPPASTAELLAELEGTPVSQQEGRGGRRGKLRTGKRRPKSERKRRATRRTPRFVY